MEFTLKSSYHLWIVRRNEVRNKDGDVRGAILSYHFPNQIHGTEKCTSGVGEVINDEHVVLAYEECRLLPLILALDAEELLLRADGLTDSGLLDEEYVIRIQLQPINHCAGVAIICPLVWEENEGVVLAGVVGPCLEPFQEIRHKSLHSDRGTKVADRVADGYLFVELHEEIPIRHSVSDLGATIRMERFVPYFLERFKAGTNYPGKNNTFILFPDKGAYDRYAGAVVDRLKLDPDHILFIKKTRVGESISTEQKFFCIEGQNEREQTALFVGKDHVLIIDDFTNSGSTLFGAVNLVRKMVGEDGTPDVSIFVSHLVATYDPKVVAALQSKLHELGPTCKLYTTNSIATTTDLLKDDPQVKIIDISDFIADLVH
mmetsp:Transcript_63047/g.102136  ORF Transcript_63047/g.102136 Transcript_63047/m.102136 type:complete len:374 (-) Transcript_63047:311-1432(-)